MGRLGRWGAAIAAAMLVAGCGGDDGESSADDEKAMKAVIVKAFTTDDPQVKCVDVVTRSFVTTIYRTVDACKVAEGKPDQTKPATDAALTDVKIDGDRATADVRTIGGSADGARGEITFAKEDDAWKVDELSLAFIRSRITVLSNANREGPFAQASVRSCFTDGLAKVGDAEFRELAYDLIAQRDPHPTFVKILTECTTAAAGGDVSALRKQFEEGVTEAARKDGASQALIDCVNRELRDLISDEEIVKYASDKAELAKRGATAMRRCQAAG